MSAATVIALLVPLNAGAQPITHRLVAETFSLTSDNLESRIWSDRVQALLSGQRKIRSAAPNARVGLTGFAYRATFKDGARVFAVSVLNDGCANTSLDYAQSCPARIVEITRGSYRIIKEIPDFIITTDPNADGTNTNNQSRYMTVGSFDASTRSLSFVDIVEGQRSASAYTIQLN